MHDVNKGIYSNIEISTSTLPSIYIPFLGGWGRGINGFSM